LLARPDLARQFVQTGFHHPQGIVHLPEICRDEWLLAFAPISVTVFLGLLSARTRLLALAFCIGLTPYLITALRLLVGDQEQGAYLLPLAMPAAWITARLMPRPILVGLIALSALLSLQRVLQHDDPRAYRTYAQGLRQATGGRPLFLMLGDPAEVGPCLVYVPDARLMELDWVARLQPDIVRQSLPSFDSGVTSQWTDGRDVLLTAGGERFLAEAVAGLTDGGPTLLAHIRSHYRLVEVQAPGFRALRLEAR
jgi:hypothetical protein